MQSDIVINAGVISIIGNHYTAEIHFIYGYLEL